MFLILLWSNLILHMILLSKSFYYLFLAIFVTSFTKILIVSNVFSETCEYIFLQLWIGSHLDISYIDFLCIILSDIFSIKEKKIRGNNSRLLKLIIWPDTRESRHLSTRMTFYLAARVINESLSKMVSF